MGTLDKSIFRDLQTTAIVVPAPSEPLRISYEQLSSLVTTLKKDLAALGIKSQAPVSISLPNSIEFAVAFLAVANLRAIAAPLNPAYKQEEVEFYVDDLSSALLLVPRGAHAQDSAAVRAARKYNAAIAECYWDGLRREVILDLKDHGKLRNGAALQKQPQSEDIALVLHTSGTTGRPKAVPLTHRNLTRTMKNIQNTYHLSPTDRTLLVMPLFHVHGLLAGFLAPLLSGGSVIIPPRFSASEFWQQYVTYGASWYTAVPTIHQILLKNPVPQPKPYIRFIRSCSSSLSPTTLCELEQTFGAPVLEAYAMTEAAHQMTSNPIPPAPHKPGSVGIAQGVEVKILNQEGDEVPRGTEGEICVRGENVTEGYLNNAEANKSSFTESGFFRTGDQGMQDDEGYVFITGRIKELINKGGEKISPVELDNVLAQHPVVAEAVSFAIPDDMYGQDIGVAIVVKSGEQLTKDELIRWAAEKVVRFKLPRKVFFTETMPKTATGKVQRKSVADTMLKQEEQRSKL